MISFTTFFAILGAAALNPVLVAATRPAHSPPAPPSVAQKVEAGGPDTTSRSLLITPARPLNGTLIRVTIARRLGCTTPTEYTGTLAGQPLHFEQDDNGRCVALAAIPIDSVQSVTARVFRSNAHGPVDTLETRIPVVEAKYPTERLRVAPRFGSTPDSALKARTDNEAAQALAVARRAHETPKLWRGAFHAPRPGRVTSGFGRAREFNGELQSRHMGTDFAGAEGTPVRASNRGVVALIGDFYYGGTVVYLDHGAGLVTGHMHLSKVSVAAGDTVERGQIIGRVGSTGRVTGPHLHWIVRYGQVSVDPLSLLSLTTGRPAPTKSPRRAPSPRPAPTREPPRSP